MSADASSGCPDCAHPHAGHLRDKVPEVIGFACNRSAGPGRRCASFQVTAAAYTYCMLCREPRPGAPEGDPCNRERRRWDAIVAQVQ